jgi:predicted nucleotidyltransferase
MKRQKKVNRLNNEAVIKRLRAMNPGLNKDFGVSKIGVFGSYARSEQEKDSPPR